MLPSRFINRISAAQQLEEPPQFSGGIIADPMGLGKTLTVIALAASDLERGESQTVMSDLGHPEKPSISATLIIIPPPRG